MTDGMADFPCAVLHYDQFVEPTYYSLGCSRDGAFAN